MKKEKSASNACYFRLYRKTVTMLTGLNITPEQLTEILRMFKVDMSEWGTPGHGTAQDLFSLIERGDAFLKIRNRGLALSTQTARALIRNAQGKVLVCGNKNRQGLDNSDLQLGFSIPGGLIRGNSDARSTLERELLEEAGFKAEEYVVGNCVTQEGKRAHGAQQNLPI